MYIYVELARGLQELSNEFFIAPSQVAAFGRDGFIRLKNVVAPAVLVEVRQQLCSLASIATGGIDG